MSTKSNLKQALENKRFVITAILSLTFLPPRITTKGQKEQQQP